MTCSVENPSADDAYELLKIHWKSKVEKPLLLIAGDCLVDYHGRARSLLDWGERIILVKQDGAVLVHQPVMREPVNWQPAGSKTMFHVHEERLMMRSWHRDPPEKMVVMFRSIKLVTIIGLRDHATLVIAGMETDVVNQIISNPNVIEEGLRISKREKHVKSGIVDLFGYDQDHVPVIIEVKRSVASISAVQQLRMYVSDVKKDIEEAKVRGILCAPRVPDLVKKLLSEYGLEWREVERQVVLPDDHQKKLSEFSEQSTLHHLVKCVR